MCIVYLVKNICFKVVILLDFVNDLILKREYNMLKRKFRNVSNEVLLRIYIVEWFLFKKFVRYLYVCYKIEYFNFWEVSFIFIIFV